jgi:hypothetical protein
MRNREFGKKRMANCNEPVSIVCDSNGEEERYFQLVQKWVDGEISYSELINNYPKNHRPILGRIKRSFYKIL